MSELTRRTLLGSTLAAGLAGCEAEGRGRRGAPSAGDTAVPATSTVSGEVQKTRAPNILYLYADQFRWNALGVAGMPLLRTPSLDLLAASSVRFSDCVTSSPLCMPARSVMHSGVLASRAGVLTNNGWPLLDGPSHVRRLRDEGGYRTGVVGKVHLHHGVGHKDDWIDRLDRAGFSDPIELSGVRLCARFPNAWSDWLSAQTTTGPDRYQLFRDFVRHYEATSHVHGEWLSPRFDDPRFGLRADEHVDSWIADTAVDWITEAKGGAPWYLQVNFPGPHPPWDAPAPWADLYDPWDDALPVPTDQQPGRPWSGLIDILHRNWASPTSELERRQLVAKYFARVSMIDAMVGRVVDGLAASGQLDDTWIVFSADHGELMGDKNLVGKIAFFDGSIRIPLIVRPPGGASGWVADGWCDQLDVTATLLALGGLEHGIDLAAPVHEAVLAGPGAHTGKEAVISEVSHYSMLVDGRYKVVADRRDWSVVELYDRADDPEEWVNRVRDGSLSSVGAGGVEQMRLMLGV